MRADHHHESPDVKSLDCCKSFACANRIYFNPENAIHAHVLTRLFEELVEEPSNILFTTVTGPETTRYDAMNPSFWLECLDLMEKTYT